MQRNHSSLDAAAAIILGATIMIWPPRAHADLYVCAQNAIRVFADDAQGFAQPIRIITGLKTGIEECYGVALDASHGEIWVANGSLSVFSSTANGNVAPLRQINGNVTFAASVAVYGNEVMMGGPGGVIATFDRLATGNAVPLRTMDVSAFVGDAASIFIDRTRNEVYASDYFGNGAVYAFSRTQTGAASPTAGPWLANASRGIFFDPTTDLLYVAGSEGVKVFGHDGSLHGQLPSGGAQLTSPWGITVTNAGQLIVADEVAQPSANDPIKFYSPFPFSQQAPINIIYEGTQLGFHAYGIASSDARACGWGNSVDDCVMRDGFEGGNARVH